MTIWGKSVLGRGNGMCRGPVLEKGLVYWRPRRNSEKASVALEWNVKQWIYGKLDQRGRPGRNQIIRDPFDEDLAEIGGEKLTSSSLQRIYK